MLQEATSVVRNARAYRQQSGSGHILEKSLERYSCPWKQRHLEIERSKELQSLAAHNLSLQHCQQRGAAQS